MENNKSAKLSAVGRKKFHINFIDIILILIILLTAAILGYVILSPDIKKSSNDPVTIQYEVEIPHLREEWKNNVEIGDSFIELTTQKRIGTVVDIRYSPEIFTGVNLPTGELVYTNYTDYLTMIITVEAEAGYGEVGYDINGYGIQIGPVIQFRVPGLCYEGACKSIDVIEGVAVNDGK